MQQDSILQKINSASTSIGKTWPLYSFVTSNPLVGFESKHFKDATLEAEKLIGGNLFPQASDYRNAWKLGDIDSLELKALFDKRKIKFSLEESLLQMDCPSNEFINFSHEIDRLVIKWLIAFLDEGLAEWSMPNRERGFYNAWKTLVPFDGEINLTFPKELPEDSLDLLNELLKGFSDEDQVEIIKQHLSALPGWTGYIKYRVESNSGWQQKSRITLEDYLAVRLCIAKNLKVEFLRVTENQIKRGEERELEYLWLKAWEKTWQKNMAKNLDKNLRSNKDLNQSNHALINPDAQLVFCIDTRSELIRRHVESSGNYETFGYAGFFGIAMDYENFSDGVVRKSCPPIVASTYKVIEQPKNENQQEVDQFHKRQEKKRFTHYFLKRMKHMLPSAFGYVEGAGFFYGVILFLRTIIPGRLYNSKKKETKSFESICNPNLHAISSSSRISDTSLEDKVSIVKSAFDLLGWKTISPLVLFVGHGGHSANNPFGSSLDCGACAGSPGRQNARMLAKLANQPDVRQALEMLNIHIPHTTVFLGAEHNTTTDEIILFDSELPDSHKAQLSKLKENLFKAQISATSERLGKSKNSVQAAHTKSNNWSETRPEWGLAKNAGFIIGSRSLTKTMNMNGNCFLHSYDWEMDVDGKALDGIMQGPMVVTQWINNHYYFATVDNDNYGGGSKITHNVTGRFGVMQGNGGDLKRGLPLQSVNETDEKYYHQPLRLSVYIHAPKERVNDILQKHQHLKSLIDNEWIYLMVIDPHDSNQIKSYEEGKQWKSTEMELTEIYQSNSSI